MKKTAWILAGLIVAPTSQAADLAAIEASVAPQPWARWQGRVSFGTPTQSLRSGLLEPEQAAQRPSSLSLMGDYYFSGNLAGAGSVGGFRATSGVVLGPRSQAWSGQLGAGNGGAFSIGSRPLGASAAPYGRDPANDSAALPYLGLGYSGLSARSGWSFSADLGLTAQSAGNVVQLGRGQSLDDVVRELRLAPVLQLGVSYSF